MRNPTPLVIGSKVVYIGRSPWAHGVTGVIRKFYEPASEIDGERIDVNDPSEWHAAVDIDSRPADWPYPENSFAPTLDDLERQQ